MAQVNKRSTIYFEADIHKALRLKAAGTHRSISELVNEAIRHELLDDQEDLASFEAREGEPTVSYEEFLNTLKADGKI